MIGTFALRFLRGRDRPGRVVVRQAEQIEEQSESHIARDPDSPNG